MSLAGSAPLTSGGNSQGPTLAPPFEPIAATSSSSSTAQDEQQSSTIASGSVDEKKQKKRRSLFGFGKKKGENDPLAASTSTQSASTSTAAGATPTLSKATLPPPPPPKSDAQTIGAGIAPKPPAKDVPGRKPTSPILTDNFNPMSASITSSGVGGSNTTGSNYGGYYVLPPSSPGRSIAALSSSPRMSSPAGSQIFERDVQESNSVLMPGSPAIPSHITTENFIPPVLDASSEAITDGHLDPDTVEIITHTHHQPAGLAVAGVASSGGVNSSAASGTFAWVDDVASSFVTDKDDSASNYGSFDTTDIRRLSFISFADVVQAEQQQQQHQQATAGPGSLAGLTSLAALSSGVNRSPSPMRSPTTTDRFGTSPPASKSGSVKNLDLSPQRSGRALGSPTRSPKIAAIGANTGNSLLQVGSSGGEISVETMSQALRRTGSGDLSGVRSTPQSPV
ncbi:hypothetical protein SBRCBS47491_005504 [Sporothrix bragantina]|uniref:Uncharacterized protein n=1 Tax=Sporothrix bragantina TaxID=671064 RepID=A0ABP0BXH9_9PEZI